MKTINYLRSKIIRINIVAVIIFCFQTSEARISEALAYSPKSGIDSASAKYIDPTAAVNGTGTYDSPWNGSTLAGNPWVANQVYLFKRGTTYSHSSQLYIQVGGVTLGAYGSGARPILQLTANTDNIRGSGSITLQDLELINISGSAGQDGNALNYSGATGYLTVNNCKMHGGFAAVRTFQSSNLDVKVTNCEIYDCWSDGLFLFHTHSIEIGYCNIYNVNTSHPNYPDDGDGIHLDNTPTVWIHHNNIDHTSQPGKFCIIVAADIATYVGNATIEYNTMKRNRAGSDNTIFYSNYAKGSTIIFRYNKVQDALLGIDCHTADMQIYYNSFSNIGEFMALNYGFASNVKIYNNTFSNCGSLINGYGENVDFRNNIVHTITGAAMTGGSNIISDYNDYYNVSSFVSGSTTKGDHDISADPLFTNLPDLDFTLKKGSPCFDKGTTVQLPSPIVDLNGDTVPKGIAVDMGAYEYIPTDKIAPTAPTGLVASNISYTGVTLAWTASTDNIGVTGYNVYKDGIFVTAVTDTSANVSGLTQGTSYSMTIRAKDADDNFSLADTLVVTTTASTDTQSPSIPDGLISSNIKDTSFTISWTGSTDNVGVSEYDVYLNGSLFVSVAGTTTGIDGLIPGTIYSVTVKAKDIVGNTSIESAALAVKTIALCSGSDGWTPTDFGSNQTGTFTAEFDAVPQGQNMAGLIGLSDGHATTYGSLACIVSFGLEGKVLARNAGAYNAVNVFPYTPGTAYHIKFTVNVAAKTYDATIKEVGGLVETIIASHYAFRAQSAQLNCFVEEADQCHVTVTNYSVSTTTGIEVSKDPGGSSSIIFYPNPASSYIDIKVNALSTVSILNIEGKLLVNKTVEEGTTSLPLNLETGLYFIRVIEGNTKIFSGKLMVK